MKLPKNIKVGQLFYDVTEKPVIIIEEDRNFQGSCSYTNTAITILDSLSEERKKDVFFHELTHAIFYEAGFEDQDEDMINRVAKVIHQVMSENDFKFSEK